MTVSPGSHIKRRPAPVPGGIGITSEASSYALLEFSRVIPEAPAGPIGPCIPWIPCGPVAPVAPVGPIAPCGPAGPAGPTLVSLWSFLSSNLICLQNSTELTKKPSNGPVLHSYFYRRLDIGYKNYLYICHILELLL
jgi:hypothetical protein